MATKKCPNGHQYDSSIYGDNCPFCPSLEVEGHTQVCDDMGGGETKATSDWNNSEGYKPTMKMDEPGGGHTVIRTVGGGQQNQGDGRRMVGILVSYSQNSAGEVYKIYEGRTVIGRDHSCDISFPTDTHMSGRHFLIQFVGAKGLFKAKDMGSSNGSFVNGSVYVMDESVDLKTNDVIVLGETKLLFMAIPSF